MADGVIYSVQGAPGLDVAGRRHSCVGAATTRAGLQAIKQDDEREHVAALKSEAHEGKILEVGRERSARKVS